jgi:small-conductance mechanosensitive channel
VNAPRHLAVVLVTVTGLALVGLTPVLAQEPEPLAAEPTATPVPVFEIPEVTARSQETQDRLKDIGAAAESASTDDIVAELDEFADTVAQRMVAVDEMPLDLLRRTRREELQQEWQGYRSQLDGWERRLLKISSDFEATRVELEESRELWDRTLEEAEASQAPDALLGRIRGVITSLEATRDDVSAVRDGALTALDTVADIRLEVDRVLEEITASMTGIWQQALTRDGPPLWSVLVGAGRSGEDGEVSDEAARPLDPEPDTVSLERMRRFVQREKTRLELTLVLLVGLTVVLLLARRRIARDQVEEAVRPRIAAVVQRPFAGALLTTALIAAWLLPGMPLVVRELVNLVVLGSWLRLIRVAAPGPLRLGFYAVAALYVADHYGRLLIDDEPWARLYLLAVSTTAAAVGVRALRRDGPLQFMTPRGWGRFFRALVPIGTLLLVAASIANIVGAVTFAQLLTRATVTSAAVAAVLFLAVLVLDAVVLLIMQRSSPWLLRTVRDNASRIEGWLLSLVSLGAMLLWTEATLNQFGLRDRVAAWLRDAVAHEWTVGDATISVSKVLTLVLVFIGTLVVSRVLRALLEHDVYPRLELPRGVPNAVSTLVRYAFVALALLLAPLAAGVDFSNLAFIAGGLGVGIGFGLQNIVANFVSGLILAFERPIQVGDTIQAAGHLGNVRSIGVRSSTIRKFDGAEVVVPNSNMVSDVVLNWTLSDMRRRMQLDITVAYGANPHRVLELLREAASSHEDVFEDPAPLALFRGFTDTGLAFRLLFWIPTAKALTAPSDVGLAIFDALEREGYDLPIPRQQIDLVQCDDARGGVE